MTVADRPNRDYLTGEDGQAALLSLTPLERLLCRWFIARQFAYAAKIPRVIDEWGLEGAVKLCSARAMLVYLLGLGVIGVISAIAGFGPVAIPANVLVLFLVATITARSVSAARSGRRWKRSHIGNSPN